MAEEKEKVGVVRDISEPGRAEEERVGAEAEAARTTTEVIKAMPDPLIVLDLNGVIVSVNPAYTKMFGHKPEERIGKSFGEMREALKAEDIEKFVKLLGQLIETGEVEPVETVICTKDGRKIPVSVTYSLTKDAEGNPKNIIALLRDITETKKLISELEKTKVTLEDRVKERTAELEEAKGFSEGILASMFDGLIVTDLEGNAIEVNDAFLKMLGYEKEDLIGKSALEMPTLNPKGILLYVEQMKEAIETGKGRAMERLSKTKDGRKVPVLFSGSVMRDDGKIQGIVCVALDITERKKAEDQIRTSLKEKEVLLREIHHRVKDNLQIISSLLNLEAGYVKDKQMLEIFKKGQNRIRTMALIHEKLYQSKDLMRIDFAEYIQSLTNYLFRSYGVNPEAITLKINIGDLFLDVNTAIPCGLIVNELVSNSMKHAFPEGREGKICINFHSHDDKFTLIVSDNGVSFPKDLDFRNTETLGLQLVCILTDQLGGSIELDRSGGTELKITFKSR